MLKKLTKVDIILTAIFLLMVIACLILEFVNVPPFARAIVGGVTGVYALVCMLYFKFKKGAK